MMITEGKVMGRERGWWNKKAKEERKTLEGWEDERVRSYEEGSLIVRLETGNKGALWVAMEGCSAPTVTIQSSILNPILLYSPDREGWTRLVDTHIQHSILEVDIDTIYFEYKLKTQPTLHDFSTLFQHPHTFIFNLYLDENLMRYLFLIGNFTFYILPLPFIHINFVKLRCISQFVSAWIYEII